MSTLARRVSKTPESLCARVGEPATALTAGKKHVGPLRFIIAHRDSEGRFLKPLSREDIMG